MRKLLLNVHIYGGLLCFSYLILFGVSSFTFNHESWFPRRGTIGEAKTWQRTVDVGELPRVVDSMSGDQRVATKIDANHRIRAALNLFGHPRPWQESWWDAKDPNHYHASIVHPGRQYEIDVFLHRKLAKVTETRNSPWRVIGGLHGFHGKMPGSALVSSWTWYTELCTFVVLFAGASGVYLWTRRRNERRIGAITLASAAAFSLALMLYITLHG